MFLLGFVLFGTLHVFCTWVTISFHMLVKFFYYSLFKCFLRPFLFLLFFWGPYNSNLGTINVVIEVSETVLISFFFFFFLFFGSNLHYTVFQLTYSYFSLIILLLIPSSTFFISIIVLSISVCLFFKSSISVKHLLCLLGLCLHSFSKVLDHLYYHYSETIFQVGCLSPLY